MGVKFMYIGYLHACYLAVGFKDLFVRQNVFCYKNVIFSLLKFIHEHYVELIETIMFNGSFRILCVI